MCHMRQTVSRTVLSGKLNFSAKCKQVYCHVNIFLSSTWLCEMELTNLEMIGQVTRYGG